VGIIKRHSELDDIDNSKTSKLEKASIKKCQVRAVFSNRVIKRLDSPLRVCY
jgi:hypothetical protein